MRLGLPVLRMTENCQLMRSWDHSAEPKTRKPPSAQLNEPRLALTWRWRACSSVLAEVAALPAVARGSGKPARPASASRARMPPRSDVKGTPRPNAAVRRCRR